MTSVRIKKLDEAIFIIRGLRQEAVVSSDTLPYYGGRVVLLPCGGDYSIIKLNELVMQEKSSPEGH